MPIHRISSLGFVNAYLVPEEDGFTLVDAMLPRTHKKILAAAEALGAPIRRIALTHAHGDHIGALDALAAALPGVEVLISARDARLLAKDTSLDPDEPQVKLRGGNPGARTRPTATFAAGDRVGSLEVHAAPGHTPGQVAFRDPRDGTSTAPTPTRRSAASRRRPRRTGASRSPRWRPGTSRRRWTSARALRALDPARLAPGHGPVVEAPGAAMDRAIARGA